MVHNAMIELLKELLHVQCLGSFFHNLVCDDISLQLQRAIQ